MRRNISLRLVPVLLVLICLFGCGSGEPQRNNGETQGSGGGSRPQGSAGGDASGMETEASGEQEEPRDPGTAYQAPAFADSSFHAELAEGNENVKLDLSSVSLGYVGLSVKAGSRVKMQVTKDGQKYNYDVPSDGTPIIFPLQCGDGSYDFFVGEQVEAGKYAALYTTQTEVTLQDEFQPFLRPSAYVDYNQESKCVLKAAELAQQAGDALGVVEAVFEYICDTVTYDKEKAKELQGKSGYMPVLDETLESGKGICFDYAALAAGMLRSQGIPTKMVFGNVSPDDVYHAWNMFYTDQTGWVTVKYEVKAGEWNRLDLTFSANGADADFIGDGSNYADVYYY